MSCERCSAWFSAKPPYDKTYEPTCRIGQKLHRQMMKENS